MPGFDGTGPVGLGPFSGRGRGYCMLRLPDAGVSEVASGFAGYTGNPVNIPAVGAQPGVSASTSLCVSPIKRCGGYRGGWHGGRSVGRW